MLGETLNIMTLGGLALAVGILVDDATVTIENINWHLEHGKPVETAILDGAAQIVTPAFVSLLCICIVFVPMFFLDGVARFLFVPMAEAVIFAMIASFILSRTLVPTLANYLLKPHVHGDDGQPHVAPSNNPLVKFQHGFESAFETFRGYYHGAAGGRPGASAPGGDLDARLCGRLVRPGAIPGPQLFPRGRFRADPAPRQGPGVIRKSHFRKGAFSDFREQLPARS